MDSTRSITITLYVLLGVVTVLILLKLTQPADLGIQAAAGTSMDESSTFSAAGLEARRNRQANFASELRQRDDRINRLEAQLQRQNAENRALKARLDESQTLMELASVTRPVVGGSDRPVGEPISTNSGDDAAAGSIALNAAAPVTVTGSDLEVVSIIEQARLAEVERLRGRLSDNEETLAQLRQEADQELARLEEEGRVVQSAATEALVRSGTAAVPGLVTLLGDRSALVREWSAYVLGQMGADAVEAKDELQDLATDPDEHVRVSAREALRRIEEAE